VPSNVWYKAHCTVDMDNYYMSTTCAAQLHSKGEYCRGARRSSRKFKPKGNIYRFKGSKSTSRYNGLLVNPEHHIIAICWLANHVVSFKSTSDCTTIDTVQCQVGNEKQDIPAPIIVSNYNKYMSGVGRHDRLQSTFSLGEAHRFKKYYIKLLLLIIDVAWTNTWIYYSMVNPEEASKKKLRADFLSMAPELT